MPKPQKQPNINKAKDRINEDLYQQSFLGASITNFSINLGLNSQPSTLNVSLVEDDKFYRNPNAVLEGYHAWDVHAFPLELYDSQRTNSLTAVGQICDPNLVTGNCKPDTRPWEHCDCTALNDRREFDKVPDYLVNGDHFFKPRAGAPVYFNYKLRSWGVDHPNHTPPTGANNNDYSNTNVFEFNGILKNVKKDYSDRGITYQVEVEDPRKILEDTIILLGERFINPVAPGDLNYPDKVESFNDGQGLVTGGGTEPADTRPIDNQRAATGGYTGYYNVLNVFGYYEFSQFRPDVNGFADLTPTASDYFAPPGGLPEELGNSGANPNGRFGNADVKEAGMTWYDPSKKVVPPFGCDPGGTWGGGGTGLGAVPFAEHESGILPALNFMLMGGDECYKRAHEPMGGPVYYVTDNRNTVALGSKEEAVAIEGRDVNADRKEGPYRYKVDLTDLYNLHKVKNPPTPLSIGSVGPKPKTFGGGNLDSGLRINESSISLLSLIQTICEAAGADFFVELIRDPEPGSVTPFTGAAYENWYGNAHTTGTRPGSPPLVAGPGFAAGPFPQDSTYAGIIKVWAIPRNESDKVVPNIVGDSIKEALERKTGWWTEEQFKWDGTTLGYNEPIIISSNIGYEYNDAYTGVFMIGGPRTRMVGVTPLGRAKSRYDEAFDSDGDGFFDVIPKEYLPSTELDGASLGYVTGSQPIDTYDERGKARARGGICLNSAGVEESSATTPAACTGSCSDPAHTTEAACVGAGFTWDEWTWTVGWSSDEYRAWQNDLHPYDADEGIIKADMNRLNEISRGKCTKNVDATERSDDDQSDNNSDEDCEGKFGGNCYVCLDAAGNVLAGRSSKVSCDTPPASPLGTWTKADASSRADCAAWADPAGATGAVWLSNSYEEGDGYIDLYPMWGWAINTQELIQTPSKGFIKNTTRGNPIKGFFNDDDPYRDFDTDEGIYSNKHFFDRFEGLCSAGNAPGPGTGGSLGFRDSADVMDKCLYDTIDVTENGETRKKKIATGNSYTLFCHDPYGRKEIVMTSSQEGACTGMTCPDTDPDCQPKSEECCTTLGGSWVRTGESKVTAEEVDVSFSRCKFYDEPDPYNYVTGVKQAQKGGCLNPDYKTKKQCDTYADCFDSSGASTGATDVFECTSGGTCTETTEDATGTPVTSVVTASNRQECREHCCSTEALAGDNTCKTEWTPNTWTGWNPATGDLVRPDTATIPINLHLTGFIHGPSSTDILVDGVTENYYLATVTELRHAANDQDAWFKYLRTYDSWLPCKMGWKECIMNDSMQGGLKHAQEAFFGVGRPDYPAVPPISMPSSTGDTSVDEHNDNIPYACKGTRANLTPEEHKKMEKNFSWRVVNEVATKYYGRTYLMQLPFAPPLEVGCSADSGCECCKDENGGIQSHLQDKDSCEHYEGYTWETPCEKGGKPIDKEVDCVNFSASWRKRDTQADCEIDGHTWGPYGIQSEWQAIVWEKDGEVLRADNRWDIASAAWPFNDAGVCVDFTTGNEILEMRTEDDCFWYGMTSGVVTEWFEDAPQINTVDNLRYPANQNFWNEDGNLEAFVAFPHTEIQRLSHQPHELSFREFNPETFIHQGSSDIAGPASSNGTMFVKASVAPQIYWLPEVSYHEVIHGETGKKRCYVDGVLHDPEYLGEDPIKSKEECLSKNAGTDTKSWEWKGERLASTFLKPYALINIEGGTARYDLPDTYNDKRAQLFPAGEPFADDCDAHPRIPHCETGAGIVLRGDPTHGTPQKCSDNGGVWVDQHARHECQTGADAQGCHWSKSGRCIEAATGAPTVPPVSKREDCLGPINQWEEGGYCVADAVTPIGSGYCEDASGIVVTHNPTTGLPITDDTTCEALPMHTWIDTSGRKLVQGVTTCIPLTKINDSRTTDAYLKGAMNNYFHHPVHMRMGSDINRAPMVSAAFKPYYAGVPVESRVYYWGPWSKGKDWGKVLYVNDSSYHPGTFGAESEMANAARARCLADVDQFRINQEVERGSVTMSGPPMYDLGTHVAFSHLPPPVAGPGIPSALVPLFTVGPIGTPYFGPLITDMSVDVGENGITTTYNMQLQPKFGDMHEIQERRAREHAKMLRDVHMKQEENLRRSRLPDPQQFRSKYRG